MEALRGAQTELLKSEAALNNAKAQAEAILAQAEAANNNALAALNNANAEYKTAQTAWEKAQKEYDLLKQQEDDKIALEEAAIALEEAKINLEAKKRAEEIAKANAEMALEKAKLQAEKDLLAAQKENLQSKIDLEKVTEGLANEEKIKANYINRNIKAIMSGGDYYMLNSYGSWIYTKTYQGTYWYGNAYTSIQGLIQGIANEKVNLVKLQNDLIDIEEYLTEKKADNDEIIATKTALIAKYKELQAASNREAMEKAYEEAKTNAEDLATAVFEKQAEKLTADNALTQYENQMSEDPIQKLVGSDYLTPIEQEALKDTIVTVDGSSIELPPYWFEDVYEHTAEDAEELAEDIAEQNEAIAQLNDQIDEKEKEIAKAEAELPKINITEVQREAAVAKAEADAAQKQYDDIIASEAYKTYIAALEKAKADAQAAFDKAPSSFTDYKYETNEDGSFKLDVNGDKIPVYEKNEDGTFKFDENGNPIQVIEKQGTLETLKAAEIAWGKRDEKYQVEGAATADDTSDDKYLSDLYYELEEEVLNVYGSNVEGLVGKADKLAEIVKNGIISDNQKIKDLKVELGILNEGLETLNEGLEALKEIETAVAPESEEMKAYLALCEGRAELEKAIFALNTEIAEMGINKEYYNTLKDQLEAFVGDGETTKGSLPNYEELIADAEKAIKDAEQENANLETTIAGITIEKQEITITNTVIRKPEFNADGTIKLDVNGEIVWTETSSQTGWNENSYTTTTNVSKTAKEAEIAKKTAEIAAMEAELEIRQAEYDTEVAALKALVETAE